MKNGISENLPRSSETQLILENQFPRALTKKYRVSLLFSFMFIRNCSYQRQRKAQAPFLLTSREAVDTFFRPWMLVIVIGA